jgi:hypothetical protein
MRTYLMHACSSSRVVPAPCMCVCCLVLTAGTPRSPADGLFKWSRFSPQGDRRSGKQGERRSCKQDDRRSCKQGDRRSGKPVPIFACHGIYSGLFLLPDLLPLYFYSAKL